MFTNVMKIQNRGAVDAVVAVLRGGGTIILPTESSYGIAADATNKDAVAKVYILKKRIHSKSLPVIVASVAMAKKFFVLNKAALRFCKFFPAPLTLLVRQKRGKLADNVSADNSIAFRVPKNKFCRDVSQKLGRPITSTSANISGKLSVFSSVKAKKLFNGKVELIVDAGNLSRRKPSTIVNCVGRQCIVRQGAFEL